MLHVLAEMYVGKLSLFKDGTFWCLKTNTKKNTHTLDVVITKTVRQNANFSR